MLSHAPISGMVPVRDGATPGRYIMDWNKDSVADANFAKIDLLSLPVLDQLQEVLDLVERREGVRPDLSRLDPEDSEVYDMINNGRSKGVFLPPVPCPVEDGPATQVSMPPGPGLPRWALIRPGVGVQGSAVSQFVERYRHGAPWEYDHPLEERALERGCGIIVWQEQVVQLIMDVAGMTAAQADEVRRAFSRPNADHLIAMHSQRFIEGALENGVPEETASRIFDKINGHYMFPESHSHAFAVTAYQAAWLKRYHPLEFFGDPGEQPTYGLLPPGDHQGGRPAIRRGFPQPLREPQSGEVHPRRGLSPAGFRPHKGRGRGVGRGNSR